MKRIQVVDMIRNGRGSLSEFGSTTVAPTIFQVTIYSRRVKRTGNLELVYLHMDPGYEPLRVDPRFRQLVERIGLC